MRARRRSGRRPRADRDRGVPDQLNTPSSSAATRCSHLQLDFFDYPDEGIIEEYRNAERSCSHAVAEFIGDWRIIRDAWVDPQVSGNKPLDAMAAEEATGVPFEQAFMDFAARNVTWDYAHGDWYAYYVDYWVENFPQYDHRFAARFEGGGSDGEWSPDVEFAPRRYGVNTISLMEPEDGDLYIDFDGDESGSRGSAAAFGVTAVRVSGDEVAYDPLMLGDVGGELVVSDVRTSTRPSSSAHGRRISTGGVLRLPDPPRVGLRGRRPRGHRGHGRGMTRRVRMSSRATSRCGRPGRIGLRVRVSDRTPAGGVALGLMAVVVEPFVVVGLNASRSCSAVLLDRVDRTWFRHRFLDALRCGASCLSRMARPSSPKAAE